MKYAVDEIIDNICIIENIETGEKKEVNLDLLPEGIHDGSIVVENINYEIDIETEEERYNRILEKMNRLKNIKVSEDDDE